MAQFFPSFRCFNCRLGLLNNDVVGTVNKSVQYFRNSNKYNYTVNKKCFSSFGSSLWRNMQIFSRPANFKCLGHGEGFYSVTVSRNYTSRKDEEVMNVFDRKAKRLQRNRTALLDNYEVYDYLKEEVSNISVLVLVAGKKQTPCGPADPGPLR